jgi:hypothetical protein
MPTTTKPEISRPHVPGYGVPRTNKGTLPWTWARERLDRAMVYWLATSGSNNAPHLIPIWGAWVNDRWYVEGGNTRWKRNLEQNPQLAIHVEFGEEVVIVEGRAREVSALDETLAEGVLAGYRKYKSIGYEAEASNWTGGGLWELEPVKAFAWSSFPKDMTRYTF